ncbi:hypothetical protein Tsubulata_034811, partial [Turnera subulata]
MYMHNCNLMLKSCPLILRMNQSRTHEACKQHQLLSHLHTQSAKLNSNHLE